MLKDGGILDSPELSLIQAKYEILKCFGRSPEVTVPITGEEYHEILGKINEAGLEFIHKARQGLLYSEGIRSDSDGHEKMLWKFLNAMKNHLNLRAIIKRVLRYQ